MNITKGLWHTIAESKSLLEAIIHIHSIVSSRFVNNVCCNCSGLSHQQTQNIGRTRMDILQCFKYYSVLQNTSTLHLCSQNFERPGSVSKHVISTTLLPPGYIQYSFFLPQSSHHGLQVFDTFQHDFQLCQPPSI